MNMTPMQPRNSANLRGVWAGDSAPAITAIWFAMNGRVKLTPRWSLLSSFGELTAPFGIRDEVQH